jgi:uncharacterized protein YbaP (TraB family)
MRLLLFFAFLTSCTTVKRPFLYEAKRGGDRIALLGTIHVGIPKSDLPSGVLDELRASDATYFENLFTVDDIAGDSAQAKNDQAERKASYHALFFRAKGEPSLDERLGPHYWQKFLASVPKAKPSALKKLNPRGALGLLMADQTVRISRFEANMLNPYYAMDFELEEEARDHHLPLAALDDDRMPCRYERGSGRLSDLRAALDGKHAREFLDDEFELVEAYRTGDENNVRHFLDEDGDARIDGCILGKRNRTWADKLDRLASGGKKLFVAVGCAHLLTQKNVSLLDLLRQKGFSVERVGNK